ncbi:tail tubular protein A [Caulobacter phage Percy]|uniref:Tail tubular protein A n=1 Tax=Caulobacter phage Percy TaxID=1701809 RepID=A0A0M5M189_9CAUD|nr:tail protein [Caulobacter phage Percy]ALF01674.1 tail tubular protein A [Caulobacter phage Percy]
MAFLTTLDVINAQLATLGEAPLNDIEEDHPFVAAGLLSLRTINNREQAKGWWFNKEIVTLNPDATTGSISIPDDAISVDPIDGSHYVMRGRRLYNPNTSTYVFTAPVRVRLIRRLDFEDLPPSAADYIALSATYEFADSYDADKAKVDRLSLRRREALITLNSEHIRNSNVNFLDRPATAASLYRLGRSPQLGGIRN